MICKRNCQNVCSNKIQDYIDHEKMNEYIINAARINVELINS